jgi:XTP/dITP diphosphohydrolase
LTFGQVRGEILPVERGEGGFGYDRLFYLPELGKTMAELSLAEKNEYSHRARAVIAMLPYLRQALL